MSWGETEINPCTRKFFNESSQKLKTKNDHKSCCKKVEKFIAKVVKTHELVNLIMNLSKEIRFENLLCFRLFYCLYAQLPALSSFEGKKVINEVKLCQIRSIKSLRKIVYSTRKKFDWKFGRDFPRSNLISTRMNFNAKKAWKKETSVLCNYARFIKLTEKFALS